LLAAGTEPAQANAVAADVGTKADPWQKGWFHELSAGDGADVLTLGDPIQHANEAVSSATTIGNVLYVEVDTSVGGFTITIPASLEQSGIEIRFVDGGAAASSNSYDVTAANWTIDGSGTVTVDGSDTVLTLYSAGDRFVSSRWVDTVDAETITTDHININNLVGAASLSTDQIISTGTVTQVNLDQNDVEDDAGGTINVDLANNKLIIKSKGLYEVVGQVTYGPSTNWTDGDEIQSRIQVDNTTKSLVPTEQGGANRSRSPGPAINIISVTEVPTDITLHTFHNGGTDINIQGKRAFTYLQVKRLG